MRALLMVQTGNGLPKCLGVCSLDGLAAGKWRAHREDSDRWWLVAAESAEAARAAVATFIDVHESLPNVRVIDGAGTILAFGGRS